MVTFGGVRGWLGEAGVGIGWCSQFSLFSSGGTLVLHKCIHFMKAYWVVPWDLFTLPNGGCTSTKSILRNAHPLVASN